MLAVFFLACTPHYNLLVRTRPFAPSSVSVCVKKPAAGCFDCCRRNTTTSYERSNQRLFASVASPNIHTERIRERETMVSILNPSKMPDASAVGNETVSPLATPVGRTKSPPMCIDSSLKATAMTTEELSDYAFPPECVLSNVTFSVFAPKVLLDSIPVSSSSSTCTRESDASFAFSDVEMGRNDGSIAGTPTKNLPLDRDVSERMNAVLSLQKNSRQGRATQRWITDSESNESIRLVTGCVPILRDGRILVVSASRKPEWILPKGGWEEDETMEESAARECFEEAGVLGVLGPKLSAIQYETRKAKKRRLQLELDHDSKRVKKGAEEEQDQKVPDKDLSSDTNPVEAAVMSDEALSRIRKAAENASPKAIDDTLSVASSATYNKAHMTMFPLYVSSVVAVWPESGRCRKAVDIDEAIALFESRPELQKAIIDVKERGLHLLSERQPR
jgi:diphosphoinositol-polyphosphate diphosphatase